MNTEIAKTSKVCEVCNVIVTGEASWQAHVQGKRHINATEKHDVRFEKSLRSVYVGNLPPGTNETILFNYFMRYADVTEVIMDKNQGKFAIIEFSSSDSIGYVIGQKHFLSDRRLMVQRRKLRPETPRGPPRKEVVRAEEARSTEQLLIQVYNQLVVSGNVAEQMDDLVNILKLPNRETELRGRLIEELTQVLRRYFSYSEVHVYGSSGNGLGQVGCDLDILVSLRPESEEYYQVDDNGKNQQSAKQLLQNAMQGFKITPEQISDMSVKDVTFLLKLILYKVPHCQNILLIPSKRCPIVRFTHSELALTCDVSVKHRMCLYNTHLIRLMTQLDRRALLLFFTIKHWAKVHEIGGGGGARLSSYSLIMLAIFYLQNTVPQMLPTVMQLRDIEDHSRIIAGWDCSFCSVPNRIPITQNRQTVDTLLKGFFRFYADFDFMRFAVCPRIGKKYFPKSELAELIPNVMEKPLVVQDPFELSHNLTSSVSDKVICTFMEAIRQGNMWANSNRNIWISSRDGSNWGILCLFERFPSPKMHPILLKTAKVAKQSSSPTTNADQQSPAAKPSQQSSYWATQKDGEQGPTQQPPQSKVASTTFWSTAKKTETPSLPQPTGAAKPQPKVGVKAEPTVGVRPQPIEGARPQPKLQPTAAKATPPQSTPPVPQKPVSVPQGSKDTNVKSQPEGNDTVLPSPIRAWPPITTAVIQQPAKRKRKSKLLTPQQRDGELVPATFIVAPSKPVAEKLIGAPQNTWDSNQKDSWAKQVFQVLYTTFSDALQMPCSELEVTTGSLKNVSNSDGSSSTKRIKTEDKSSPTKQDNGLLTASFLCSVYHRTWERRRHFKQRIVPTSSPKPYLEVEEKISMMVIESVASTPDKPLFSFKCYVENTEDLSEFKVSMVPTAYSTEFVGVAVDFYKSFVPKAVLKAFQERAL